MKLALAVVSAVVLSIGALASIAAVGSPPAVVGNYTFDDLGPGRLGRRTAVRRWHSGLRRGLFVREWGERRQHSSGELGTRGPRSSAEKRVGSV